MNSPLPWEEGRMTRLALLFLVLGAVFLCFYFFFLFFFNQRMEKEARSSFLNSFGYQFYASMDMKARTGLYVLLIFSCLLIGAGEVIYLSSMNSYVFLILSVLFPLSLLFLTGSNLTPLSKYRLHILFDGIGFVFFALSCLVFGFSSLIPGAVLYKGSISLASQIIVGAIGALALLSLFNKRLLDWAKMERSEVDGTTYYQKPKVNFLALYEWCFILAEMTVGLVFFVNGMLLG